ncbi:HAD family hydrolase [Spirillospora sp. NPDC048911]|uniref:HAD family hydrolase n=1 Tax=Spirillospora sp. NPDC048911 TaxID=3364527 RepID=UPI003720FB6B
MIPLQTLTNETSAVLLDFDGPVCRLFAGYPAPTIAGEMRNFLQSRSVTVPDRVKQDGPLTLLKWTSEGAPHLLAQVEKMLCSAELEAANSAAPTPGADAVITAAARSGRPVAIVSNNSTGAIARYLESKKISTDVSAIVGRPFGQPDRMKPDAYPLLKALGEVNMPPQAGLLIGDSDTDIQTAKKVGTRSLGYATRPIKFSILTEAGAENVIDDMGALADALESVAR